MNTSLTDVGFLRVGVFTRRSLDLEVLIEALTLEGFDESLGFVRPAQDDERLLVGVERRDRVAPRGMDELGLIVVDKYWFVQVRRWQTERASESCYVILDEGNSSTGISEWLPHDRFRVLDRDSDEVSIAAAAAEVQEYERMAPGCIILWMIDDEPFRFGADACWGQAAALASDLEVRVVRSIVTPTSLPALADGLLESWSRRLIEPANRQRTPLVVVADNRLVEGGGRLGEGLLEAVLARSPEAECFLASARDPDLCGPETIKHVVLTPGGSLVAGEDRKVRQALERAMAKAPTGGSVRPRTAYFGVAADLPAKLQGIDENLTRTYLDSPFTHVPLLDYYSQLTDGEQPFEGKDLIFVLHFLRDLVPFVVAAERLGLEPPHALFLYKRYPYPQRSAVGRWLHERGYTVLPVERCEEVLGRFSAVSSRQLLVVEDGGHVAPALHRSFPNLLERTLGVVEQTSRGIGAIRDWLEESPENQVKTPILSVATSALKGIAEPRHVAAAVVRNVAALLEISFSGRNAAVIGCGTIGIALIEQLLAEKAATVYAFDRDPNRLVAAEESGASAQSQLSDAVRSSDFCFGCTGRPSLTGDAFQFLKSGVHLVSASSEQYEIDIAELYRQALRDSDFSTPTGKLAGTTFRLSRAREIYLVANGYPINFWGMNSLPDQVSDLIMTLLLLSAVEIASGSVTPSINANAVDDLAKRHQLASKYRQLRGPR